MKKEFCNCKVIHECEKLNELAVSHKFNDLKTNYTFCGFDRKVPKYCCPPLTHAKSIDTKSIVEEEAKEETLITSITNFEYEE